MRFYIHLTAAFIRVFENELINLTKTDHRHRFKYHFIWFKIQQKKNSIGIEYLAAGEEKNAGAGSIDNNNIFLLSK